MHSAEKMKDIKVHPIPLLRTDGKLDKPKMTYLYNFGQGMTGFCYLWLIEGLRERIVVDTGATADMMITRGRPREEVKHVQSLGEGLARFGLEPSDIDTVVITHLHWDHIALAHQFINAKFVIQEDEISFALNPHPIATSLYDKDLFEGVNIEVIKGDCQITDGIKVLLTPGHTPGGQSIAIETEKGTIVITGFCCIQENFEPQEEIRKVVPIIVPGIHLNVVQAYDSMLRVKEAADIIVPLHEQKFASMDSIP